MVPSKVLREKTHTFENKVVTKSFGPIHEGGSWRGKIKNCDPDIIAVIKSQHLGWLGYVKGRYNGGFVKISGIENRSG